VENRTETRPHGEQRVHREARRYLDPEVAAVLHRARRARGWSYRVAGRRMGVSYGYLAELEAGHRVPSTVVAEVLVDGYGLTDRSAALVRSVAIAGVGRDWRHGPPRERTTP
jgi:ribosome-binding protein aMBF1 (putative translation factor)